MNNKYICIILLFFLHMTACKKSKYLEASPNKALIIPETLSDYQAILDNSTIMNGIGNGIVPTLGEASSDDYYVIPDGFSGAAAHPSYKRLYTWEDDYDGLQFEDWGYAYKTVFYANVVLDGLRKIEPNEDELPDYNNLRGSALFYRANVFYQLSQVFALPFDPSTADADLGIVIKANSDINEKIFRSSVRETYEQIIKDLKIAIELLPSRRKGDVRTRPSKPAAQGLLARTYLTMRMYDSAFVYADACLNNFDTLLNYNNNEWVSLTGSLGIKKRFNPEVIFPCSLVATTINSLMFSSSRARVDSILYSYYSDNDLRKSVFFASRTGAYVFKGSYDANSTLFGGIATDEIYLIRSECFARKNNIQSAMDDLNKLVKSRWDSSMDYVPLNAGNLAEALELILTERRKELVFRGIRWSDIRRLNKEGKNIELKRIVDGNIYILPPNSLHYAFLIPPAVITFNPQLGQNKR